MIRKEIFARKEEPRLKEADGKAIMELLSIIESLKLTLKES